MLRRWRASQADAEKQPERVGPVVERREVVRFDRLHVLVAVFEVQPVAGLPWETVTAGGEVAIVNLGPTAFDARAAMKIDGKAGEVLRAVVNELG